MGNTRSRILWITRTGLLAALLVVLQWSTSGAGQFVTGSCVNGVLAISVLAAGLWSGVTVAILSPFCAKLIGIGPQLIQIVPAISVGNLVFVLILYFVIGRKPAKLWQKIASVILAAFAKFLALYLLVVKWIVYSLADGLPGKMVANLTAMFSWPQLVTALIGGAVALLILPVLKKAMQTK